MVSIFIFGFLFANAQNKPLPAPAPKDFSFMLGCWENHTATEVQKEGWSKGKDAYRGHSETLHKDRVVFSEIMSIVSENGAWTYHASPMGKPAVVFTLEECSTAEKQCANFANRKHDFPQEIIYSQPKTNRKILDVELRGVEKKKPKNVKYALKQVPC